MKINVPIGTKIMVEYNDPGGDSGCIIGDVTNIFIGLVFPNLNQDKEVAGVFVESWTENGKILELKENNNKVNIFKSDRVSIIE